MCHPTKYLTQGALHPYPNLIPRRHLLGYIIGTRRKQWQVELLHVELPKKAKIARMRYLSQTISTP